MGLPDLGALQVNVRGGGLGAVVIVVLLAVWKPELLAPPGSAARSWSRGTGCCRKAYGGHSERASLGSLSERLGMGRAGSRMAFPLRSTHKKFKSQLDILGDVLDKTGRLLKHRSLSKHRKTQKNR